MYEMRLDSEKQLFLPPRDAQLIDPQKEKIDTPLIDDERMLIDIPKLIQTVQETVDPEYLWPRSLSVHHFYWPEINYPYLKEDGAANNPSVFRNLPIHKGLLPRVFENWLHQITLPPPVPTLEAMRYRVDAWLVARNLFSNVKGAVQWERKARRRALYTQQNPQVLRAEFEGEDIIGQEVIQETLESHFRGTVHHLQRASSIPAEFRLFDPTLPRQELATQLGRIVTKKHLSSLIPKDRLVTVG